MSSFVNLEVRVWSGDAWPEKRVSIACTDSKHAVMISPRYATIEQAESNARHIVHCVNNHDRLVEALRGILIDYFPQDNSDVRYEQHCRALLAELDTKGDD